MGIPKEQVLQNKNYISAYSDDVSIVLLFVPLASMRFRFSYVFPIRTECICALCPYKTQDTLHLISDFH